MTKILA